MLNSAVIWIPPLGEDGKPLPRFPPLLENCKQVVITPYSIPNPEYVVYLVVLLRSTSDLQLAVHTNLQLTRPCYRDKYLATSMEM